MTTETEPTTAEQTNSGPITIGAAFSEYFREAGAVKDEDKPEAFPEVQRFVRWIGDDHRVDEVIASEVARFSETYRANASEDKKARAQHIKGFLNYLKKRTYTTDNLASHIRVRPRSNNGQRPAAARRQGTVHLLTQQGHDEKQDELAKLVGQRARIANDIQRAAASGDVRENAPLEAARQEQGQNEAKIREIETILESAQILDESDRLARQEVQIGSYVTINKLGSTKIEDGKREFTEAENQKPIEYQVVSASEAKPLENKISDQSPVGSALLGKKTGSEVEAQISDRSLMTYKIVSIN